MPGCYGLSFYLVEFDRTCQENQLMADCVVVAHEFVYFQPCFGSNGGVELHQMHVVFNKLEEKQQGAGNFIHFLLDDDLISDNSKFADKFVVDHNAGLLAHAVDED